MKIGSFYSRLLPFLFEIVIYIEKSNEIDENELILKKKPYKKCQNFEKNRD